MKLSSEQIKTITVGAVSITEEPDGMHFFKCTDKQNKAWAELRQDLGYRALTTTGVRLDFHTDSQNLGFTVSGGKFELYVDNLLRGQYNAGESSDIRVKLCDPLGDEQTEYRVTLYFPSHSIGVLKSLEIDDGAKIFKHFYGTKILFIGDSITQGWNTKYDSLSYAYRVSRYFNAESVIQGVGGGFFCADTFDSVPFAPEAVVVAYGTNDFGHDITLDEFRKRANDHLTLISKEYKGKHIFVISPIWRDKRDGRKMGTFQQCRQVIAELADELNMIHIDGLSLVPPLPELFADGYLHPNSEGFSLFAENLAFEMSMYI